LISLIVLELCPGQRSKSKNRQRAIIKGKAELQFLCIAHLLDEIYLPTKFHVDTSKFKVSNEQRAITPKLGKTELRFLCNAHIVNEIYLLQSFMLIPLVVSKLCPGQEKTERRTDGRTRRRLYAPPKFFGEHGNDTM
jgi:hypothetical protein